MKEKNKAFLIGERELNPKTHKCTIAQQMRVRTEQQQEYECWKGNYWNMYEWIL